ncbi:MAG: amidohydrolase family protein [Alphaproteobacteria bacterium]|uniref:Amidohydrolase family protein n=1 Tax=Candidatus Nitrobium versatile TaxID=2884831 RepID=A0A953M140_9BACT|nr:amidohydrolase family protein [Candidatus Nitrobium versatile]
MRVIDVHTHGIGGYDTRTADAEHLLRIAELHGAAGVSEIVLTLYPATIRVMRESMAVVREAMERQKGRTALPRTDNNPSDALAASPAQIRGVHLEGPFLNPAKCGALNAMTFLEPSAEWLHELLDGFEEIVKIITVAPEMEGALPLIRKIADSGIVASMGHSAATYAQAEAGFHAGARGITHLFNAMSGFHHREPGLAGFGLLHPGVYVEVIADPYHLHPKTLELIFRTKSPDRILLVSDTVRETTSFTRAQGVTDRHGTLLGGCLTLTEAVRRLQEEGLVTRDAQRYIAENPGRYLQNT